VTIFKFLELKTSDKLKHLNYYPSHLM